MPQMPSIPYASPTMYSPDRGTERLIDLMLRRGDVEARGQAASGEIWGRAVQDVGQIAGQAVAQYGEDKKQKKREELFNQAPELRPSESDGYYRQVTTIHTAPRRRRRLSAGIVSFIRDGAEGPAEVKIPTPDRVPDSGHCGWAHHEKAMPGFLAKHYPTLSPILKRGAELYGPGRSSLRIRRLSSCRMLTQASCATCGVGARRSHRLPIRSALKLRLAPRALLRGRRPSPKRHWLT